MRKSRTKDAADQVSVPITVQLALPLVEEFRSLETYFFELCVDTGQRVLHAMMEHDRTQRCGAKCVANAARRVRRAGSAPSPITLGGRRIVVKRLRARSVDGQEQVLPSYAWAARRDPLDAHTVETIALGVATRGYRRSLDPLPATVVQRATSKSAVSRRFVAYSRKVLAQWVARPLGELDLVAVLIDGIYFARRCVLVALALDSSGHKQILGLHEGSTENTTVAKALLGDLVERGLNPERSLLFVIDGGKGLRRAIGELWGARAVVQRCQVHKRRNVLGHLPDRLHARVRGTMQRAYDTADVGQARAQLERLARELEREHPGAAASLREGLEETLTLQRLGLKSALYRMLRSTNAIENLNSLIAAYTHHVKRWRDGRMVLRWVGAALHEASAHFNRVKGYRDLRQLAAALAKLDKETKKAA